jgi:uncharacterized protein DUF6084
VLGASAEPHAAVPTLSLRLRVTEPDALTVHAVALRCQVMIEPQKRRYSPEEQARLVELFGETPRWGDTLRPFLWTHVGTTLAGFSATTEVDLPIVCTYDFEVAAAKYLHGLDDGEIPIVLLFSGTVFRAAPPAGQGFAASPVAWHEEASYRLPVRVWRDVMDRYFPNSGWLRVSRETLDALTRFKAARALPTWDDAFEQLFKQAGEEGA